jgi:predicted metal-dependent hydrolase
MPRYKTYSRSTITISGLEIQVHRKNVKNLNLRVYPSKKEVKVSVPKRAPESAVQKFIVSRISWIRKHLNRVPDQRSTSRPNFETGETVHVWGKAYSLQLIFKEEAPKIYLKEERKLMLQIRPGTEQSKREQVFNEWLRVQMKEMIPKLIAKWEPVMGVKVNEFGVKRMKTRWGTCNIRDQRIWLNLELAKKRPEFLEYVVVHEMVHLLERLHNDRFYAYMTRFYPKWPSLRKELKGDHPLQDC